MMDKKELTLHARIYAMQLLLVTALKLAYGANGLGPDFVAQYHQLLREKVRNETWPTDDPAMSDLVAAEVEDEVNLLLSWLERDLGMRGPETPPSAE